MPTLVDDPRWETILQREQSNDLSPREMDLLRQSRASGHAPAPRGRDPNQAVLSAASPEEVTAAQTQPPLPPEPIDWRKKGGRYALEIGVPLGIALLTRNPQAAQNVLTRAAELGLKVGMGTTLGSLGAETFDPTPEPLTGAVRKGMEAGGAAAASAPVPFLEKTAPLAYRAGTGVARSLAAGTGAAAGSLAAEPVAPTEAPLEHAQQVGTGAAAGQAAFSAVGTALPLTSRGRSMTPLGARAAQTMQEAGVIVPTTVSESKGLRMLEYGGERSMFGGRALDTARRRAQEALSSGIDRVMTGLRGGRTAQDVRRDVRQMYQDLDTNIDLVLYNRVPGQTGPVQRDFVDMRPLRTTLQQFAAWAQGNIPSNEISGVLNRVSQTPDFVTYPEAQALRSSLLAIARAAQGGGTTRAPSSSGGPTLPGMGGRYGNTLGRTVRTLASDVRTQIQDGLTQLDPALAQAWEAANTARAMQARTEWLAEIIRRSTDNPTGIIQGKRLLNRLQNTRYGETLEQLFPGDLEQIQHFATALAFHQQGRSPFHAYTATSLPHQEGMMSKALGPLAQAGLLGTGVASGHPILGFLSAVTPEVAGFMLASPKISQYLTLGLQLPPQSAEYASLASQLVGLLRAEGIYTAPTPPRQAGAVPQAAASTATPAQSTPEPVRVPPPVALDLTRDAIQAAMGQAAQQLGLGNGPVDPNQREAYRHATAAILRTQGYKPEAIRAMVGGE